MFCIVLFWFGKNLLQALFTLDIFPLYHLSYLLLYYRTNFMFTCEECEYNCAKEKDLKTHTTSRHANKKNEEISKIGLELFALVDWDNDVNEARKRILEEFNEMEEIYEVLKVYVDKSESFTGKNSR